MPWYNVTMAKQIETWGWGYSKSYDHAKKLYAGIGRVPCPAFNNEIVAFNNKGFNHLVRKGRIPRTHNEQKKRFALIPYIEQIIKNPAALILFNQQEEKQFVNRRGHKVLMTGMASYWRFIETVDGCKIKVVIRQFGEEDRYFLSVMGDTVKMKNGYKKAH